MTKRAHPQKRRPFGHGAVRKPAPAAPPPQPPVAPLPPPPPVSAAPPPVSPHAGLPEAVRKRREALDENIRRAMLPPDPAAQEAEFPVTERLAGQHMIRQHAHDTIALLFRHASEDPSPIVAADATSCLLTLAHLATASGQKLLELRPDLVRLAARRSPFFPLLCAPSKKILAKNQAIILSLPVGADLPLPYRDAVGRGRPLVEDAFSEHIRVTCQLFHHIINYEAAMWQKFSATGQFVLMRRISQLPPLEVSTCPDWAPVMAASMLDYFSAGARPAWLLRLIDPKASRQRNIGKRKARVAKKFKDVGKNIPSGLTACLHHKSNATKLEEAVQAAEREAVSDPSPVALLAGKIQERLSNMLSRDRL